MGQTPCAAHLRREGLVCKVRRFVIASDAKQSSGLAILDCFVTPFLAMTGQEANMDIPDGWRLEEGGKALVRGFTFKDFGEAFAFLTRVAMHAEKVDHHPEFTSVWNRVDFRLTSHDAGGVTERDVKLAEAINRLFA